MKWVKIIFDRRRNQKGSDACNFSKNTLTTLCPGRSWIRLFLKYSLTTVCPKKFLDPVFLKHSLITVCHKKFLDPVFLKHPLITVCGKIKKIVSDKKYRLHGLRAKLSDWSTLISPAVSSCRGAILIEFAICMPILIIALFYINDLMRIKRYYAQTEFVAQQMANIIQNISQKREGTNKKINNTDLIYAASLAYLSMYPGTTMYRVGSKARRTLSHTPRLNIFYIEGLSGGKASCLWGRRLLSDTADKPTSWATREATGGGNASLVYNTKEIPSDIYKNLKISENEKKIIVEANIFNANTIMREDEYVESDRQEALAKKAFKCRLIAPKPLAKNVNDIQGWYFTSVVILTPKPGLFDGTAPADS